MTLETEKHVPPRRTQAERRAQSDQSLLLAAAELIAEEGFQAATFEKVGARAGYSRGLASQRFGSKDGLIEALINELHERSDELGAAADVEAVSGLEEILGSVDTFLRNFETEIALKAYFVAMAGTVATLSRLRAAFAASHMKAKLRFMEQIARGQADGTVSRDLDAEAAALMIGSLLLGVSTQWLIDPTTDLDRIRRTTLDTLRRSLATTPR
ncbi:TetR/AcrR family transcriptional regulator [Parvibaculum sp.]|uniref:TetR/AcrR family transcriptional regulator n=1 Tax=Parvibaculum sp. TaxID=2024848 RepID=UPI002BE7CAC7|nr:TetR/AcrR family transcriptional regulator [Parvibaculum sp.]HUD52196.1 TetR/AcrR family transcriptional regulator [Parvibaculum sp.]